MKRSIFLLAVLLCFVWRSSGWTLAEEHFFKGEPHASTLDFRLFFETMSAQVDTCTLSIQDSIYDVEKAQLLLNSVRQDLQALAKAAGVAPTDFQPCTVYIVSRPPNGMERQGNRVYCTQEDVGEGCYLEHLACALLGTEEFWKGAGLAGAAEDAAVDEAVLATTYAQMSDLDLLSLHVSYYTEPFATREEIALAKQTAIALCRYIVGTEGYEAFRTGDCIAARQEWLQHIGVDRVYNDPCYPMLMNYRFAAHSSYPLVAVNQYNHRIYLEQMADMSSAKDLRMFLYDLQAGPQAVLDVVAEKAPERLDAVKARYEGRMWVYCGSTDGSYTYVEGRNIYLQLSYAYLHELGHILFPTPKGANFYSQMWQYEGLCDGLGYSVYASYARQKSCFEALQYYAGLDQVEEKTPNQRFYVKLLELYLSSAAMPEAYEEVDIPRFYRCMAAVPLMFPDAAPDSDWVHPITDTYPGLRSIAGNELTYQQAYAFSSWLIEKHSFVTYLDFCLTGQQFEAVFGIPYEEAKTDWLGEFLPAIQ